MLTPQIYKNPLSEVAQKLFKLIGVDDVYGVYEPVIELSYPARDKVYVKFMSDKGCRDEELGIAFQRWLSNNGVDYITGRLRSLMIKDREGFTKKAGFDLWTEED